MALPLRPLDLADLLRNLLQASEQTITDNPAELLTDYVSGTAANPDDVSVTDSLALPNFGHSGTYVYADPTSKWNAAQWS